MKGRGRAPPRDTPGHTTLYVPLHTYYSAPLQTLPGRWTHCTLQYLPGRRYSNGRWHWRRRLKAAVAARGGTRRRRVRRRRRRGWRRGGRGGGGEEEEEREEEGGKGKEEGGGGGLEQVASARGVGVGVGTVAGSSSSAAAGAGPSVATSGKHSLPTLQWSSPKPRWAGSAWPCARMADLSTRAPPFFAPPPPQKAICAVRRLARRRRRKFAASRQPAGFQEEIRPPCTRPPALSRLASTASCAA